MVFVFVAVVAFVCVYFLTQEETVLKQTQDKSVHGKLNFRSIRKTCRNVKNTISVSLNLD